MDSILNHVDKVKTCNPSKDFPDSYFQYIDLSSVNKDSKVIEEGLINDVLGREAASRAKQLVQQGDILISTVRPNLNGVAMVTIEYDKAVASSGYSVLRTKSTLDKRYLFHWVQSKSFVEDMINKATGASYPAVSDNIVKASLIPLPPLPVQQKIAAILDEADKLRQLNKRLIAKYDELTQSLFLDMFGDPVENTKGWEVKNLKKLSVLISSGNTPKGGSNVYVKDGIVFFRSQNVWRNKLELDDVAFIDSKTHASMKKSSLKYGDILMTKTGRVNTENSSLGRAAMYMGVDDGANVNGHVYLIRLQKDVVNDFILFILTTNEYREYIRRVCVGGIDKRQINKEHLEEFPIICPPIKLQNQFVERLQAVNTLKIKSQQELSIAENLFNGLLQSAFKGELVS